MLVSREASPRRISRDRVFALSLAALLLQGCVGQIGDAPDVDVGANPATEDEGKPITDDGSTSGGSNATGGAGGTGGSGGAGGSGGTGGSAGGGSAGQDWQPVETDWCTEGWTGLDDHTCFFVPDTITTPTSVLYFLHGMMQPDSIAKTAQKLARDAAQEHGFIAVFPRGRQGLCAWADEVKDWWCWPSSRTAVDASAGEILKEWSDSEALLGDILDVSFTRRYVLGFSNGGYFAAYIGLEGLLATDGIGVVGAGRANIDESLMPAESTPFYIAVGELEIASTKAGAQNLAYVLDKHGWPHDLVIHAGQGHSVNASDFDNACATWGF
jgi:predicted esterase